MTGTSQVGDPEERRRRGLERMGEVYAMDFQDGAGDFLAYTADHLFGDIWCRPGLDDAQRRLMLVGLLVAQGRFDVLEIQLGAALARGELGATALREIVVFLSHYAGWPAGATVNTVVETLLARSGSS